MSATLAPAANQAPTTKRTEPAPLLRRAAVLGAGTMGSRIAAHLANAGIPVVLLDIVPAEATSTTRNLLSTKAIEALLKAKPAAFYENSSAQLITPGNLEDDLNQLAACDWIIEAVSENLAIKQSLLKKIVPHLRPNAIVTTNTSGLPIASIAAEMPSDFRKRWFGTHFFNPPRYMRLLEIIPTPDTDPADHRGHRELRRPPPRQVHRLCPRHAQLHRQPHRHLRHAERRPPDAGAGPHHRRGRRPDRRRHRLAPHRNLPARRHGGHRRARQRRPQLQPVESERRLSVELPAFIETMLERKWLGDKAGQGFYKKTGKDEQGRDIREALDWKTLEYRPASRPKFPSLKWPRTPSRSPSASGCCSPATRVKIKPPPSTTAVDSETYGTTPPNASLKSPTTRPPSIRPCEPASTGS
jgi:3-hydroxyacyl-CoA dehydrogenase